MGIEHQNTGQNLDTGAQPASPDLVRVEEALEGARQHLHGALQEQLLATSAGQISVVQNKRAAQIEHKFVTDKATDPLEVANARVEAASRGLMVLTRAYLGMQGQ